QRRTADAAHAVRQPAERDRQVQHAPVRRSGDPQAPPAVLRMGEPLVAEAAGRAPARAIGHLWVCGGDRVIRSAAIAFHGQKPAVREAIMTSRLSNTMAAASPPPLWGRDRVGGSPRPQTWGIPPPLTPPHKGEGNSVGASEQAEPAT